MEKIKEKLVLRLEKEKHSASGTLALGTATAWLFLASARLDETWKINENPQKLEGVNMFEWENHGKTMGQDIINSDFWIAYGSENPTIYFDEFSHSGGVGDPSSWLHMRTITGTINNSTVSHDFTKNGLTYMEFFSQRGSARTARTILLYLFFKIYCENLQSLP